MGASMGRFATRIIAFLLLLLVALLGAFLIWYRGAGEAFPSGPGAILLVCYPKLLRWTMGALWICWCLAVLVLVYSVMRKQGLPISVCSILAIVVVPIISLLALAGSAFGVPGRVIASLQLGKNKVYYLQHYGAAGGCRYVITEELEKGRLFLRTRVLGRTNCDYPYYWTSVVRSKTMAKAQRARAGWRLVSNPNATMLVALLPRSENHSGDRPTTETNMVYDLRTRRFYGNGLYEKSLDIRVLSPFILLGDHDEPDPADVNAICSFMENNQHYGDVPGESGIDALAQDAENTNPSIRLATAQILGHYWHEWKLARQTLKRMATSDTDVRVRETARSALALLDNLVKQHQGELAEIERGYLR